MQKRVTRGAVRVGVLRDGEHQMFSVKGNVEWARPEDKPGMRTTSWFNTMLIRPESRASHPEERQPRGDTRPRGSTWSWGHEHECLVEPTDYGDFSVSQPGSSVVTSLVEGEAKKKQVLLLRGAGGPGDPDGAPYRAHRRFLAADAPVQVHADFTRRRGAPTGGTRRPRTGLDRSRGERGGSRVRHQRAPSRPRPSTAWGTRCWSETSRR